MSERNGGGGRRALGESAATPYLLAAPVFLYIAVLILYPIGQGIYTSFTRTELLSASPPAWVGLANYRRLAARPGLLAGARS